MTERIQTRPEQESDRRSWNGTATQLLKNLNAVTSEDSRHSREWPKEVRSLGNKLRRLAAPLRSAGIDIAFSQTGHTKARIITISALKGARVPRKRGDGEGTLKLKVIAGRKVWWGRWVEWSPDGKKATPRKDSGQRRRVSIQARSPRGIEPRHSGILGARGADAKDSNVRGDLESVFRAQ
jgi:hypothetical protein